MFHAFCPRHQAEVLLSPDGIESIVNGPDGIEIRFTCPCGGRGVVHTGAARTASLV